MTDKEYDKDYETLLENVVALAKTEPGKIFIWKILEFCDVFTPNAHMDNSAFYLNGRKGVGADVLALLEEADPTIFPKLILHMMVKNDA